MSKFIKITLGIAISILCLWLAFRNLDIAAVIGSIAHADYRFIMGSVIIGVASLALRCFRWRIIGRDKYAPVPWIIFFKATNMGLMLNTFVPMRGGDLFQAYTLSKKANIPKSYALSTVMIERLVDLCPPALIIIISSLFIALPESITAARMMVIVAVATALLIFVVIFGRRLARFTEKFIAAHHSAKIQSLIDNFISGLELIKSPSVVSKVAVLTVFQWSLAALGAYLALEALGIHLNFFASYTVLAVTVLSVALPSSPGYVGIWEFFSMMALGIFGVEKHLAAGFAVVYHFLSLLPTTSIGLYYLLKDISSFRDSRKEEPAS